MSQHYCNVVFDGKPATLVMGWDRPMQKYFFNVFDSDPGVEDNVLASSVATEGEEVESLDSIDDAVAFLLTHGVTFPTTMEHELRHDGENNVGNRVVEH